MMGAEKAGRGEEEAHTDDSLPEERITVSMPTGTMADILVNQGLYDKAMHIYNEMLSSDPENRTLIQRRRELEMLIKIMARRSEQERQ